MSNVVYAFTVLADVPQGTDVQAAESIIATAAAQAMNLAGMTGNVMAQMTSAKAQTSVANLTPNATLPVPVVSPGTSTFPGAQGRATPVTPPVFVPSSK